MRTRNIFFGLIGLGIILMMVFLFKANFGQNDIEEKIDKPSGTVNGITIRKLFRSEELTKDSFKGEWPFLANSVYVEQWDDNSAVVSINGSKYALNGIAKSRFKLIGAHDAGQAIMGKDIGPFIMKALELKQSVTIYKTIDTLKSDITMPSPDLKDLKSASEIQLNKAKSYIESEAFNTAKVVLQSLLIEYPASIQIVEAKQLLKAIEAKHLKLKKNGILINKDRKYVLVSKEEGDWTDEKIIAKVSNNTACEILEIRNTPLGQGHILTRINVRLTYKNKRIEGWVFDYDIN